MNQIQLPKMKISIILIIILICFSIIIVPSFATGKTQDQAIEWAQSKLGESLDYDGAYGAQCVDLIKYYYEYLGVKPVQGNGCDYATNSLPSGWTRVEGGTPKKGDILVYSANSSNPAGHVAIYESDNVTYHQNYNNKKYVTKETIKYNGLRNAYWGYIRPDWPNKPQAPTNVKTVPRNTTSLTLSWDAVKNASSYRIVYRPAGGDYVDLVKSTTDTSYVVKGLEADT